MRQKGFTLIELLVAMAVGGILMWGIVVTIHQVVWGTGRTNSQVVTLTDVHQAALPLKKDLQMAQSADFPDGTIVELSWTDYTTYAFFEEDEDKKHSSKYELSDGELLRTYDYEKPSETTSIVGRNITSVGITPNPEDDRVINVVITATAGDISPRSETLEFSVYMRGEGIQ